MKKIFEILYTPIRRELPLFVFVSLIHLVLVVLCACMDLKVHPAVALIFPILDSYLLCVIACALHPIRLNGLIYVLYGALTTVELFCVFFYDTLINVRVLQLISGTNSDESTEFLRSIMQHPATWSTIAIIATCALLTRAIVHSIHRIGTKTKQALRWILLVLLIASTALQAPCYIKAVRCFSAPDPNTIGTPYYRPYLYSPIVRTVFGLGFIHTESKEIETLSRSVMRPVVSRPASEGHTIILIIGESYNKHHCGLYNPEYRTMTPRLCNLQEQGTLVPYTDVVTVSNLTSNVIKRMFSTWNEDDTDGWMDHTLFPAVFRQAGYHVSMLNNQYSLKEKDVWNFVGGTIFNTPVLQAAQYDWRNDSIATYDGGLLDQLPQQDTTYANELVIFHLRGQHVDYQQRYPKEWEHFHAEDMHPAFGGKHAQKIAADYANATRYNDHIVDSIWSIYAHRDAVCIYLSDHGEEVFDWRDFYERSDESKINKEIAKYQFEIPMMIMMSDSFQTLHPETTEQIRRAAHKPTSNEHMAHLLFHLGGIETTEYDPTRDVLSDRFDTLRPRYIGTGTNYDELMRQN